LKESVVHAPDNSTGQHRHWNFIGELEQEEGKQTIERQKKQNGSAFRLCRSAVLKLLPYGCVRLAGRSFGGISFAAGSGISPGA